MIGSLSVLSAHALCSCSLLCSPLHALCCSGKKGHVNYATVPSICYTHPEVRVCAS